MAMDRLGASRLAVQDQDLSCPRPGFEPRRDELFYTSIKGWSAEPRLEASVLPRDAPLAQVLATVACRGTAHPDTFARSRECRCGFSCRA
jgi:hypothetical protein